MDDRRGDQDPSSGHLGTKARRNTLVVSAATNSHQHAYFTCRFRQPERLALSFELKKLPVERTPWRSLCPLETDMTEEAAIKQRLTRCHMGLHPSCFVRSDLSSLNLLLWMLQGAVVWLKEGAAAAASISPGPVNVLDLGSSTGKNSSLELKAVVDTIHRSKVLQSPLSCSSHGTHACLLLFESLQSIRCPSIDRLLYLCRWHRDGKDGARPPPIKIDCGLEYSRVKRS